MSHTTNYHKFTNSLIIYGGILANAARLSKLSDRMFSFNIENQHFTEIHYPKTVLREMSIPRERAFHSATIAGDYLISFGGYFHRHNREEICYDNQMYLYHLRCGNWINLEALGANRTNYPKKQGVFAHSAHLRGDNALLILGGYHGTASNDFLAFTLHEMMIASNKSEAEKCTSYATSNECIANPQCGYCSSDNNCYGRAAMSNCFTNLQVNRCPGLCSSFKDCQSCLIHGSFRKDFLDTTLPVSECSWCVQNSVCHQKNDYEPCGESENSEKINYQWWGRKGREINDKSQCSALDRPPGLHFLKYYFPFDFSWPDALSIVNSTIVDFSGSVLEPTQNGEVIAKLSGFLRLSQDTKKEILKICGSYAQITLKTSVNDGTMTAANFTAEQNHCVNFLLENNRVLIDLQAKRRLTNPTHQQHYQSKVGLQNNATKAFTFEFLEPFSSSGKHCNQLTNCLLCLR